MTGRMHLRKPTETIMPAQPVPVSYRTERMDWTGPRRTFGILGGILLFASPFLGVLWGPLWLIGWGIALTTIYFCIRD